MAARRAAGGRGSSRPRCWRSWSWDSCRRWLSPRGPSPTRYVFQPFLYSRAYVDYDLVPAFFADLKRRPPSLIVDSSPDADEFTPRPSLASVGRSWPAGSDEFTRQWDEVGRWLHGNYRLSGSLPQSGWLIYTRRTVTE